MQAYTALPILRLKLLVLLPQTKVHSTRNLHCCVYTKSSKIKFAEDIHYLETPEN
jgi:hypothetical protein